jgi:Right handed beta helix region
MYPRGVRYASILALLLLAAPATATDYFVKNGGNDALDGLSLATAWATLGRAADVVNPGDTVHVQDGSYTGFYLSRSGSPGKPITFVASGSAVQIIADNGTTPDGINVEGAAYVVIDGFIVNNRTRAGIRTALSQFVTVRNCHTGYNGRWGIFSGFADDFTIAGNEAHHSQAEHGIYVSNSGDRPVIRDNLVHDNHAAGIHMNGDLSQGGDGLISNALVERNVIYGNGAGGGSAINMDGVTNSVVRNNLLFDNHASGISLYQIDGATGSTGNLVVNNTIVNASDARWCVNINGGSSGNTLVNNILYNAHSFRGVITIDPSSRSGFSSDYNSVMSRFSSDDGDTVIGLSAWQALGYDTHSFLATPADLFLTPGVDFHPRPGSPAVDAGTSTGAPALDLEGNPRPVGGAVDVGAYERQLSTCGNGVLDAGEQCENAADCPSNQLCLGCQCAAAPLCDSGIALQRATLRLRANPFSMRLAADAVIPKPWDGVDPLLSGLHVIVAAAGGSGAIDALIPGGARAAGIGWKVNRAGTLWTYTDPTASHAGITRAILRDRSKKSDGLLHVLVRARGSIQALPGPTGVRSTVVFGGALECAQTDWNPPTGPRPHCTGNDGQLNCR